MNRIRVAAVAVGLAIDIVGSVVVGIAIGVALVVLAAATGSLSPQHLLQTRTGLLPELLGLLGTTFFTGLGGYAAGLMARPHSLVNSLAVGLISLLLGVALAILQPGATPLWKLVVGAAATVPVALTGGWLASLGGKRVLPGASG